MFSEPAWVRQSRPPGTTTPGGKIKGMMFTFPYCTGSVQYCLTRAGLLNYPEGVLLGCFIMQGYKV